LYSILYTLKFNKILMLTNCLKVLVFHVLAWLLPCITSKTIFRRNDE